MNYDIFYDIEYMNPISNEFLQFTKVWCVCMYVCVCVCVCVCLRVCLGSGVEKSREG